MLSTPIIRYVPDWLYKRSYVCTHCRHRFKPDWLIPRKGKLSPEELSDGEYLAQKGTNIECINCGESVYISFPMPRINDQVLLFGDEAYRLIDNKKGGIIYTYSLIGASTKYISLIEEDIRRLKRRLNAELEPDSWKIHMTKIWSGQQRAKYVEYKDWNLEKTNELLEGIHAIMVKYGEMIYKCNMIVAANSKAKANIVADQARLEAYIQLLVGAIYDVTETYGQPKIFFDSQKNSNADKVIHQWAKDAFHGAKQALLYPFLTNNIYIPEPEFVRPASYPLLEVADIMSFVIARYHYNGVLKKEEDLHPEIFGLVRYMMASAGGKCFVKYSDTPYSIEFT